MSALAWLILAAIGVPVAYAGVCLGVLLYLRLPDGRYGAALEDLALLLTAPFVAALVGFVLARRGR